MNSISRIRLTAIAIAQLAAFEASAASYVLDNGSISTALNASDGTEPRDDWFANEFTVVAGANLITRVDFGVFTTAPNSAGKVVLYRVTDPGGNPALGASRIYTQAFTPLTGDGTNAFLQQISITQPVPLNVGDKFLVAVFIANVIGNPPNDKYPYLLDTSGVATGTYWDRSTPNTFNLDDLSGAKRIDQVLNAGGWAPGPGHVFIRAVGTAGFPPNIGTQPTNQTVVSGQSATFTVTATGSGTLSYQWRFNVANIAGATASSYTRTNAQPADAGGYDVVITNLFGGVTSAVATLTVQGLSLGGNVWYYPTNYPASQPSGVAVAGVNLALTGGLSAIAASATDGTYALSGLGAGQNYAVTPTKADDAPAANGVSTLDIALIRRHILGLVPLGSPYKLLAADVNGLGTITTVDIALIRRLILGLTNSFPIGLWRFVPAGYVFGDPANPWNAPVNLQYSSLGASMTGQDFVAIKLGDVNNSWVSPPSPDASPSGGPGLEPAQELSPAGHGSNYNSSLKPASRVLTTPP